MDLSSLVTVFDSALRLSIPLLAACLAGLWSERSGVVDIGLEGKMLVAAFAAAAAAYAFGSAWIGLIAGIGASVVFGLIHGFASISQRGNQIVSGVAINMLAAGLTPSSAMPGMPKAGGRRRWRACSVSATRSSAIRLSSTSFFWRCRSPGSFWDGPASAFAYAPSVKIQPPLIRQAFR